jgi:hypothetical protein
MRLSTLNFRFNQIAVCSININIEGGMGSVVYCTLLSNQFLLDIVSGLFTYAVEQVAAGIPPP